MIAFMTSCIIFLIFVIMYLSARLRKAGYVKYDGKIVVSESEDKKIFRLELDGDPNDLSDQKSITFRVVSAEPSFEESV